MAGAAVDNASIALRGSGAPSSSPGPRPSYLKSYPYLFVRETDQTDYFCTVCEECLTEDQLQSHLFETHCAENLPVGEQKVYIFGFESLHFIHYRIILSG